MTEIHNEDRDSDEEEPMALVGTQTGLLKSVNLVTGQGKVLHGTATQGNEVISLVVGRSPGEVLVAKKNGSVLLLADYQPILCIRGFRSVLTGADMGHDGQIMCLTVDGSVYLIDPDSVESGATVDVSTLNVLFKVNAPAEQFSVAPDCRHLLAVGGKQNRLRVWNLRDATKVYEARNPPDDWLCLAVPVWISGLAFESGPEPSRVAMVTRDFDLQLFRTDNDSRRPEWTIKLGENPLTCITFGPDYKRLYIGSSLGLVYVVDAESGKVECRASPSSAGSIRSVHVSNSYVLATGLERFVYAYSTETYRVAHKIYAKQRMCKILSLTDDPAHELKDEDAEDERWMGLAKDGRKRDLIEEKVVAREEELNPATALQRSLKRLKRRVKNRK